MSQAAELYQYGAILGNARCSFLLGRLCERGSGHLSPDPSRAASCYEAAAHGNDIQGKRAWAITLLEGRLGVQKDVTRGFRLFEELAEQAGDRASHLCVGELLLIGEGCTRDTAKAVVHLQRACALGERCQRSE